MPDAPFAQIPLDLIRATTTRSADVLVTYAFASMAVDWRTRRGPVPWDALVAETGYGRSTVARHFAWLARRGFVEREGRAHRGHPQIYRFPLTRKGLTK